MFLFAVPFNGLFLVYVAMFAFGFWGLVALLIGVPVERVRGVVQPRRCRHGCSRAG